MTFKIKLEPKKEVEPIKVVTDDYELWLGDCLELMPNIESGSVDLILTDLPFGVVNRDSNGLRNLDKGKADVFDLPMNTLLEELYRVSNGQIIIFCGKEQFSEIYSFFAKKKGTVRPIIWNKTNPSPLNGQYVYLSGVELAVWFKPKGRKVFNAFCKNTVFNFSNGSKKYHPTGKNLDLFTELIEDNSNENELILDPFMGGGTTGIACLNTNRNFIGMEIDEEYFKVAKKRIESHKVK